MSASRSIWVRMRSEMAFTFIEVIITIAVLGILTGISGRTLLHVKKKAQYTALYTTIRNLRDAEYRYYTEHDEFFPESDGSWEWWQYRGRPKPIPDEFGISIPEGVARRISFGSRDFVKGRRNSHREYFIIWIYTEQDLDGNGEKDRFLCADYYKDGRSRWYNGRIIQVR